jgi:phosphohistidine phosphatase
MKLYIARHGHAEPHAETDEERALTRLGRAEMERVALFLGTCGMEVEHVRHSGYRRAFETAEILARSVSATLRVEPIDGFEPEDPVDPLVEHLNALSETTLLVGHMPLVQRLVSALVLGEPARPAVTFAPGTVVALDRLRDRWAIEWIVTPGLLGPPLGM